jgi:DNA uptake protein ComE-like DNA-binding protein
MWEQSQRQIIIPLAAALSMFLLVNWQVEGRCYSFRQNYIAPEIAYSRDLSQQVTVPQKVNLNRASLEILKTVPGLNEELGLKLIRIRPLQDFQDLYRLPFIEYKAVQRLIRDLQSHVEF